MIVVVFRTRLRPDADLRALEALGSRMYELATSMPGFVSYKDFTAPDGESLSLVQFTSEQTLEAWRRHPEHVAAQARGRSEFFTEYSVQVSSLLRQQAFSLSAPAAHASEPQPPRP